VTLSFLVMSYGPNIAREAVLRALDQLSQQHKIS
jgi:hypothetical protein